MKKAKTTYSIFCRENRDTECRLAYETLDSKGWIRTNKDPNYIVVIGGDGSFLEAYQTFYNENKPKILFVNAGYLGFFAGVDSSEEEQAIKMLVEGSLSEIKLDTLKVKVGKDHFSAINEIKITSPMKTARWEVNIFVNGEKQFTEEVTGSGIVFSTTLGSNGLSKALGGSVISPDLNIIHYLKVAPVINKATSSLPSALVLQKNAVVKIRQIFGNDVCGYIDNMKKIDNVSDHEVEISLSVAEVSILTKDNKNFFYQKMKKAYNF